MERIFMRPMSTEEQQAEINKMQLAIEYGINTTFYENKSDFDLAYIPKEEFSKITDQFIDGNEFYNTTLQASRYIARGKRVPDAMWNKIKKTREDYINYLKNIKS